MGTCSERDSGTPPCIPRSSSRCAASKKSRDYHGLEKVVVRGRRVLPPSCSHAHSDPSSVWSGAHRHWRAAAVPVSLAGRAPAADRVQLQPGVVTSPRAAPKKRHQKFIHKTWKLFSRFIFYSFFCFFLSMRSGTSCIALRFVIAVFPFLLCFRCRFRVSHDAQHTHTRTHTVAEN